MACIIWQGNMTHNSINSYLAPGGMPPHGARCILIAGPPVLGLGAELLEALFIVDRPRGVVSQHGLTEHLLDLVTKVTARGTSAPRPHLPTPAGGREHGSDSFKY